MRVGEFWYKIRVTYWDEPKPWSNGEPWETFGYIYVKGPVPNLLLALIMEPEVHEWYPDAEWQVVGKIGPNLAALKRFGGLEWTGTLNA